MCVNVADVPCYDTDFRKKVCYVAISKAVPEGGQVQQGKSLFMLT